MGYDENTTAYYRVYTPDIHTTVISSNVKFFEDLPGSSIDNYQLWIELSDGSFERTDGTFNKHVVRNKRGRPQGWRKDGSHLSAAPTVDSIRSEQANQLPDVALGKDSSPGERTSRSSSRAQEDEQVIFQSPAF